LSTVSSDQPIFVVGASRSGTALVRSLLNNHPDVHLVGETHYFEDLRPRMSGQEQRFSEPEERQRCEDYFLALSHRPYGHQGDPTQARISAVALRELAEALGGGADAYFEGYCRLKADDEGARRWGEKTPRHVFRISEILECFPDARVVVLVRDPRAVVLSYRDWRSQGGFDLDADPGHAAALTEEERRAKRSYNIILQSMLWKSSVGAALGAQGRSGSDRVLLLRYEHLLESPEATASVVCEWLGLEMTPDLLDVPVHNSSFSAFDLHGGIRAEARDRWKQRLSDHEVAVIQRVCGATMVGAGYERVPVRSSHFRMILTYLSVVPGSLRAVVANRHRISSLPSYLWHRLRPAGP
jgi:hypothetical protein